MALRSVCAFGRRFGFAGRRFCGQAARFGPICRHSDALALRLSLRRVGRGRPGAGARRSCGCRARWRRGRTCGESRRRGRWGRAQRSRLAPRTASTGLLATTGSTSPRVAECEGRLRPGRRRLPQTRTRPLRRGPQQLRRSRVPLLGAGGLRIRDGDRGCQGRAVRIRRRRLARPTQLRRLVRRQGAVPSGRVCRRNRNRYLTANCPRARIRPHVDRQSIDMTNKILHMLI